MDMEIENQFFEEDRWLLLKIGIIGLGLELRGKVMEKVNSTYFGVYFIVPERMVLCSLKVIL